MNRCPHCNNPMTSDEQKAGRCPACGKSLGSAISAEPMRRESPVDLDIPQDSYRDVSQPSATPLLGWASIRTSFSLFAFGWIVLQTSMLLALLVSTTPMRGPGNAMIVLFTFVSLALIAGVVQFLTGMCMAVAVPWEASAKGWGIGIIISLVISLATLLFMTAGLGRIAMNPTTARILSFLYLGGILIAKLLYTGFVISVARHFRLGGIAAATLAYLVLELGLFIWVFYRAIQNERMHFREGGPLDVLFGGPGGGSEQWISIVVSTVLCGWFVSTVLIVRGAITRSLLQRHG